MSKRQSVEWVSHLAAPNNITPTNSRPDQFDHFKAPEEGLSFRVAHFCLVMPKATYMVVNSSE
jgi:hypothetical protein